LTETTSVNAHIVLSADDMRRAIDRVAAPVEISGELADGYADDELDAIVRTKIQDPSVYVQMSLDLRQSRGAHERDADVSEDCTEHIRPVPWRLEPRCDDVACADLAPGPDEDVLAEGRVPVPGGAQRSREIEAARSVRDLATRGDSATFDLRRPLERRRLLETSTLVLCTSPVEETADRTPLDGG